MIRSILNRSILAATCVLALGQSAHALSKIENNDPNDNRTPAGQAYQAAKQSGDTCPFASKVSLEVSTAATKSIASAQSTGNRSSSGATVN